MPSLVDTTVELDPPEAGECEAGMADATMVTGASSVSFPPPRQVPFLAPPTAKIIYLFV